MKQTTPFAKLVLLLALVGALALAGCGGDDGLSAADQARIDQAEADKLAAEQQAERDRMAAEQAERDRLAAEQAEQDRRGRIEAARQDIAAAATAEAAQAAYDAVEDDANATEAAALMQAVQDRTAALATMDRAAMQMSALMTAAGSVDVTAFDLTTAAGIAAAQAAIDELKMALDNAADVSDADKAMYQRQLDAASVPVMTAQASMDRMAGIAAARQDIATAETAEEARAAYNAALADATATEAIGLQTALNTRITELETMARADAQKMALMTAAGMIDTSDLTTQDAIDAANTAIAGLKGALAAAADVSEADKATYQARVTASETTVMTAQSALDHAAQTIVLTNAVNTLQGIDLSSLTTQAAIDAAEGAIADLQTALDAATELSAAEKSAAMIELSAAGRIVLAAQGRFDVDSQVMALKDARGNLADIDLDALMTQAQIDAANRAIDALELALEAATDLTDAQKLDANLDLRSARRMVASAKIALDGNIKGQTDALKMAGSALGEIDLSDLSDQAKINAANTAIAALKKALDEATHVSEADKSMYQSQLETAAGTVRTAQTGMDETGRVTVQRTAITNAITMATKAVGAVDNTATDAEVKTADDAIAALQKAIDDAVDLPPGDTDVATAQGALTSLTDVLGTAKKSRMTAMEEADKIANQGMAVTAAKLYEGIDVPGGTGAETRTGAYNAGDDAIAVTIGTADAVELSEDKNTPVAANHGWEGKRYTRTSPASAGTYEAIVYSNVEDPEMGRKFGSAAAATAEDREFEYQLTNGALAIDTSTTAVQGRVTLDIDDRSAGTESFELPDNRVRITVSGSYHGVPGTYQCTPADGGTCSATVVAEGFTLAGANSDGWLFTPSDSNARVMDMEDIAYASYGWWLHKAANDGDFTASVFVDYKGTEVAVDIANLLGGTARYNGGAAGKYALRSSTGGTNDAGHFTAKARLDADFEDDMIEGTLYEFKGADGQTRDWSVELMKQGFSNTGVILGDDGTGTVGTDEKMTKWTIGETAADAAGRWSGDFRDEGTDGVPEVVTGTFYSEYSAAGKMVGAFGANK